MGRHRCLGDGTPVSSVIRQGLGKSKGVRMGRRARVVNRVMVMRSRVVSSVRRAMEMRRSVGGSVRRALEMRRRHRGAMQTLSKLA